MKIHFFLCTYLTDISCGPVAVQTVFPFIPYVRFCAWLKLYKFFNKDVPFNIIRIEWRDYKFPYVSENSLWGIHYGFNN